MNKSVYLVAALAFASSIRLASAADITGKITLKGTPPTELKLPFDDKCSALNPAITTTRWYVVGKDSGLANVFVYISKGCEGKQYPTPSQAVELDQQGCNYEPYVLGMMTGQTLKIKNSDPLLHNVHALPTADGNTEFNLAQPTQGQVDEKTFNKKEILVKIKCDVHNWMFAYVGVMDNPYFAVSDADGNFKISNVPPGTYTLTAYHLKTHKITPGVSQEIKVADSPVTANFTVEIKPAE
jgi:plastocyanin